MEFRLETPLRAEDIGRLKAGDTIYISGEIITARDKAHARIVEYLKTGRKLPFEIDGAAIYHCGPLAVRRGDEWEVVSAGPTTSARMNVFAPEVLKHVSNITFIGKGGMDDRTLEAMKGKGVYLAYTGGAGALAAESIRAVKRVEWTDLSLPEAVWVLEVEDFGPCIVAMDSKGKSLFGDVLEKARRRFVEMWK